MARKSILSKIKRKEDVIVPTDAARPDDIVIPVMGPTGAGKSTLIRNILTRAGQTEGLPVSSHGFASCTGVLGHYFLTLPSDSKFFAGRRVVLVDTPGFDDSTVSDSEILRRISVWLASSYDAKMKVGGVIYLYPIFPNRMTKSDQSNLKIFQRLCGDQTQRKIMLATTNWSVCPSPDVGEGRYKELVDTYWKEMVEAGTQIARLNNDQESAWDVLQNVLQRYEETHQQSAEGMEVQIEIMDRRRRVPKTEAGKELKEKLLQLLREHEQAGRSSEVQRKKIEDINGQLQELKVPALTGFRDFLGF